MKASEGHGAAADGTRLFTRRWEPDVKAKGRICLVHGIGEHCGRYGALVEHLTGTGYVVSSLDLRGHGNSEGRRGDTRFAPALRDIDQLLESEHSRAGGVPVFLYGHSLGGLLVLDYVLERRPTLPGVVSSGPALHTALRKQRVKLFLARVLGRIIPSVTIPTGLDPATLSRDPAVVEDYERDPLVHKGISLGTGLDGLVAIDRVLRDAGDFSVPLLLIHGGADRLNYVSGSEEVASKVGDRCTLRIYEGIFHQPHTDPESKRVFDDVTTWLDERV